jgi:hypothetical protein
MNESANKAHLLTLSLHQYCCNLIFFRHEHQQESVVELESVQRSESHVEEDPVQHRHRDSAQNRGHEDGETHRDENQDVSHSLFPM